MEAYLEDNRPTLEEAIEILSLSSEVIMSSKYCVVPDAEAVRVAIDTMKKYQMMELDYKARLGADMVAMLTDIQLEIEEKYPDSQCTGELTGYAEAIEDITQIIQQKIDKLRGLR